MPWTAFTPVVVSLGNGGSLLTPPDPAIVCFGLAVEVVGEFPSSWRLLGQMTAEVNQDGQLGLLLPWSPVLKVPGRQAISFTNAIARKPYFIPVDWIRSSTWRFYARTP